MISSSALDLHLDGEIHVLFVGNYWPYARGGHRVSALASNAKVNNVSLVVMTSTMNTTPEPQEGVWVVETQFKGDVYRFVRRLFGRQRGVGEGLKGSLQGESWGSLRSRILGFLFKVFATLFEYPDSERSWRRAAADTAREIVASNRIDVVVSGYPLTSHIVAAELKEEFGMPWVADMTDLWSLNHNYPYFRWRRHIDRRLERATLSLADHITTVSEDLAELETGLLSGVSVSTILHGFPEEFLDIDVPLNSHLTLTYVGSLYERQDGFELFTSALKDAELDSQSLLVRFVGTPGEEVLRRCPSTPPGVRFEFLDRVPRDSVGRLTAESHFLLLFGSDDPSWSGVYPSKVFDYLGVRRPILYVGGRADDLMSQFLNRTQAGMQFRTELELQLLLSKIVADDFDHRFHRSREQLELVGSFSHASMSRSMFDLIKSVAGRSGE